MNLMISSDVRINSWNIFGVLSGFKVCIRRMNFGFYIIVYIIRFEII